MFKRLIIILLVLFPSIAYNDVSKIDCMKFKIDTLAMIQYANTDEEKRKIVLNGDPTITDFVVDENRNIYIYISALSKLMKYDNSGKFIREIQVEKPIHALNLQPEYLIAFTGEELIRIDSKTLRKVTKEIVKIPKNFRSANGLSFSYGDYLFIANIKISKPAKYGEEIAFAFHIPSSTLSKKIINKEIFLPIVNYNKDDFGILKKLMFSNSESQYCGQSERFVLYYNFDSVQGNRKQNFYIYDKLSGNIKCLCRFDLPIVTMKRSAFYPVKSNEFIVQTHFMNKDLSNTAIFHTIKICEN